MMKLLRTFAFPAVMLLAAFTVASAQSPWQPLTNRATFPAGAMALLTDGTVLVHQEQSGAGNWYKLTPDNTGSYVNGTWTQIASLPAGYAPLYFSIAVLTDGRTIIEGGEYNNGSQDWTNKGAIYDPLRNTWTSVTPPSGWSGIGDAPNVVLANGTYMQANTLTTQAALLNQITLAWTATGAGKYDIYDEEGLTLMPNGNLLDVDTYVSPDNPNGTNYEIYNASAGTWSVAGQTPVQLWDSCGGSHELGPAVLRPDGTIFQTGANGCGAGHTATYNTNTGTWTVGPDFPDNLDIADGPAALLPTGNVLMMTSPGIFQTGSVFFEWDGTSLNQVPGPPNAASDSSYYGKMLVLPTGQIMFTDFSTDIEIYTPTGSGNPAWAPTVLPSTNFRLLRGTPALVYGTQFNGQSQACAYGDDYQCATNYPLVRLTNQSTGHVFYAKTHNFSTMGVQTGSTLVSTEFDVPIQMETGETNLQVVTNGIASNTITY
ncbi:MAG: hypothetical protein WCC92_10065, partial [Candidatus Korobacteraceae bacterium]